MKQEIHRTRKKELLGARDLLDGLHLLRKSGLSVIIEVTIKLMKDQNVQAPQSVAFVEGLRSLLIDAMEALKVVSIDRSLERQAHGRLLLLLHRYL